MLRILLDAHVSARVIATELRADGHDVLAVSEKPALEGLDDSAVLEMAARERRILVTHDVKDFPPLLRLWSESGQSHSGCIVVHGIGHGEFGRVLRGLRRLFAEQPHPDAWTDLAIFLSPATADVRGAPPR